MDETILSIYECLQLSEEKFLERKSQLRTKKDEKYKEKKLQSQLKFENERLEKEIANLEEESFQLSSKESVKKLAIKFLEENVLSLGLECHQKELILEQQENIIDDRVEKFVENVITFHDHLRLDGNGRFHLSSSKTRSNQDLFIEEEALKCELKVREELFKECKTLEAELENLRAEVLLLRTEAAHQKEVVLNKLKTAIQARNEISDPLSIPSIKRIEKEITDLEQETEFLNLAIKALEKEKIKVNIGKFTFKPLLTANRNNSPAETLSRPKIFTRNTTSSSTNQYGVSSSLDS